MDENERIDGRTLRAGTIEKSDLLPLILESVPVRDYETPPQIWTTYKSKGHPRLSLPTFRRYLEHLATEGLIQEVALGRTKGYRR